MTSIWHLYLLAYPHYIPASLEKSSCFAPRKLGRADHEEETLALADPAAPAASPRRRLPGKTRVAESRFFKKTMGIWCTIVLVVLLYSYILLVILLVIIILPTISMGYSLPLLGLWPIGLSAIWFETPSNHSMKKALLFPLVCYILTVRCK